MAKTLNAITLNSPAAPVSLGVGGTFTFAGTPGFSGTSSVTRYDFKWEVNPGSGYVTITGATGLTTAATNPVTNTNQATQFSATITCATAGSYTIRMAGAPATGGSYTVLSATQTVTVTAPVVVLPGAASLTTAASAPTVTATDRKVAVPGSVSLSLTTSAPTVTVASPAVTVLPGAASLSLATFAPTVSSPRSVTVAAAALVLTTYPPSVTATANRTVAPGAAALNLATYPPTVSAPRAAVPGSAALSLTTSSPSVTVTSLLIVTPAPAALALTTYPPLVTASGADGGGPGRPPHPMPLTLFNAPRPSRRGPRRRPAEDEEDPFVGLF